MKSLPYILLIIAIFAHPVFAQIENDESLSNKIDFSSSGQTISDTLSDISAITSVNLLCGKDDADWAVRDRKVVIAANQMPIRELMTEIANVLDFTWTKEENGYRLVQSQAQFDAEKKAREAVNSETLLQKAIKARRDQALVDITALSKSQNTENLKSNRQWQYILATSPMGIDVVKFIDSYKPAKQAFLNGSSASFPLSDLPADLQSCVERIVKSYDAFEQSMKASDEATQVFTGARQIYVHINLTPNTADDVTAQGLLGKITVKSAKETVEVPIYEPESAVANFIGKAIIRLQNGDTPPAVAKDLAEELNTVAEQAGKLNITDLPAKGIYDLKLNPNKTDKQIPLATLLYLVSKTASVNIVSDYFPMIVPVTAGGEQTVGELIAQIDFRFGKTHRLSGKTLVFKSTDQAAKRAWDVPEVWINYWKANGKKNNGLGIVDFCQIAGLRDEQLDNAIASNIDLMRLGAGEAVKNRELLRFILALSNEEYEALMQKKLSLSKLDKSKMDLLKSALARYNAMLPVEITDAQYIVLTAGAVDNDTVKYTFAYYSEAGTKPAALVEMIQAIAFRTKDEMPKAMTEPANKTE